MVRPFQLSVHGQPSLLEGINSSASSLNRPRSSIEASASWAIGLKRAGHPVAINSSSDIRLGVCSQASLICSRTCLNAAFSSLASAELSKASSDTTSKKPSKYSTKPASRTPSSPSAMLKSASIILLRRRCSTMRLEAGSCFTQPSTRHQRSSSPHSHFALRRGTGMPPRLRSPRAGRTSWWPASPAARR